MTVWLDIERGEFVVSGSSYELSDLDWNVVEKFLAETTDIDVSNDDDDEGLRRMLGVEKEAA